MEKKDKLIEARNRITEGIKILREVFNNSKENWCDKGWGTDMTIALGHSVDICRRLDSAIIKIDKAN